MASPYYHRQLEKVLLNTSHNQVPKFGKKSGASPKGLSAWRRLSRRAAALFWRGATFLA
jgi:hypothetical protein